MNIYFKAVPYCYMVLIVFLSLVFPVGCAHSERVECGPIAIPFILDERVVGVLSLPLSELEIKDEVIHLSASNPGSMIRGSSEDLHSVSIVVGWSSDTMDRARAEDLKNGLLLWSVTTDVGNKRETEGYRLCGTVNQNLISSFSSNDRIIIEKLYIQITGVDLGQCKRVANVIGRSMILTAVADSKISIAR